MNDTRWHTPTSSVVMPTWDAPPIPCWYCGRGVTPVQRLTSTGVWMFWTMPGHFPYVEVASSPCGGSGRLIGPVVQ